MASGLIVLVLLLLALAMDGPGTVAARPIQAAVASICVATGLVCEADMDYFLPAATAADTQGVATRDTTIETINDFQRDFFLESALVKGGKMHLDQNLHDPIPRREFLAAATAAQLPAISTENLQSLLRTFNVAANTRMASMMATSSFLCGNPALPGESKGCPASLAAMGEFVSEQLGRGISVKMLATTGAPESAPAVRVPVTILDFTTGSAAEGRRIVVCHNIMFPTQAYYCHAVTGTKVVRATLQAEDGSIIDAVAVCHLDTKLWASNHPAFAALGIPRGAEVCHFLVRNDIVWVPAFPLSIPA